MTAESISDEDARAAAQRMYAADLASQTLGIVVEDVSPGQATARMRVTETMINGHDVAHGGYTFLLADTAFAFACNTYAPTVARAAEIAFLRPVRAGDELVAIAVERTSSGRSGIYDVTVRNGDGDVVAEFRGHSRRL
ncbi:MAG TPA: hydroxyphenylacetyl-CoA thioesterase PaaI [Candidatus Dormibacteraeota bacterium]|nr:hydroxyphenylacetyl-CoA thioesterase PaaI [Candidatus Dormibacteraeota bacterium]